MENLLIKVYKNQTLTRFLKLFSHFVSLLSVAAFGFILGKMIFSESYTEAAKIAVALLIGFIFVSGVRDIIDAPRPYELYDFYKSKPKKREGKSFPSRHAYSAFAISVAAFSVSLPIAIVLLFLSALMCGCRVITGIHFIRDVAAGSLIGITAGVAALILI